MNQWKAIAAILLIFSSGAGTGYLLKSRQAPANNSNPPGGTGQFTPLNAKSGKSKMEARGAGRQTHRMLHSNNLL